MKIIRKYYLGFFVTFSLIFFLSIFVKNSPNSFGLNVLIGLAGAFVISVVCGTLYYLQDTRWGPARKRRAFLKPPFTQLQASGFTRQDEVAVGLIDGYTVIVNFIWPGGKEALRLDLLFDIGLPPDANVDEMLKDISKRNKSNNRWTGLPYIWTRNSVGCMFEYTFKPPPADKLLSKARELADVLKKERLRPMSYADALRLQEVVT